MEVRYKRSGMVLLAAASMVSPVLLQAAERQIEEVVVTAERKVSSVQDTSISITAFTSEMIDDFGIRNQSDLQNMVPATTIQPYDSAIRGVGRNFRNLGGDPGVATYMNGIYSEDLYTATIGSFWDIDRIEILRGPQGTLYGRNAVGGAMNFLYNKPTDQFEFAAKAIAGTYGTKDVYGMVSGPLIADTLNGRLTYSSREHDGWIEEKGFGDDLDSGNEENVSISLEWNITDNMRVNLRSNLAKVDRIMGGADGGGLIVLTGENSAPGGDGLRNYARLNNGLRVVDATNTTNPLASTFIDASQPVLNYTNPTTGAPITAQYVRPGVDTGFYRANFAQGTTDANGQPLSNSACMVLDRSNINGDDLCAYTNGLNREQFDQQGNQLEFTYDIREGLTFKYLFGYSEGMYERTTDDDNTANTTRDDQFYVNHETGYASNEFQLFWDVGDAVTFTSGIFFYNAAIDQRYDFYSSVGQTQYTDPAFALDSILATVAPGAVPGNPPLTFLQAGAPGGSTTPVSLDSAKAAGVNAPLGTATVTTGPYLGGTTLGSVEHGPDTIGTERLVSNQTRRDAFAAYTQGVWDINELFTLTAGIRYAKDKIKGEEVLARYAESGDILTAVGLNLATANIVRGAISPTTLQPTGLVEPWYDGVPITFGLYRQLEREDSKVTWRVNLDYNISDDTMMYGNVTTGYRAGGFNLAFFSQTPQYEPEELIAYELGLKTQMLNNTLQMNGSIYRYNYDSIHTRTEEACPPTPTAQSAQSACAVVPSTTSVQAAPGAEINGLEVEVLWLPTDELTLGGNFSYTSTEYTESFLVVDGTDPTTPGVLYDAASNPDRVRDIKGRSLPQVPKTKGSLYGSYGLDFSDAGKVDLMVTYSYIDDVYFSAFESPLDLAPAYDRIDLRATWTSASDEWMVSGFVNNVQNDIGIRQILALGAEDGFKRTAQVTEPRVFGIELSYNLR
jgi:outer membrane receptor protein involved in Fe transport